MRIFQKPRIIKSNQTRVLHGFELKPGMVYGQDENGYFVFTPNSIGVNDNAQMCAVLWRLVHHEWVQIVYESIHDIKSTSAFAQIYKTFGLKEMRYTDGRIAERKEKAKENAKELAYISSGKDSIRKFKCKASHTKAARNGVEYVNSSREIYGESVEMNGYNFRMNESLASYLDGIFK